MDRYKILQEYKNKITDAPDYDTSLNILNEALTLTQDDVEKKLLNSLVNKKRYDKSMKLDKLKIYFDIFDIIYYYTDAEKIIEDIEKIVDDTAQLNTLKRSIKNKQIRNSPTDNSIILKKMSTL